MNKTILAHGWTLKQLTPCAAVPPEILAEAQCGAGDGWLTIPSMPKMVHDVLLDHDIIQQPWLPGQAEACRWVAECDWVYAVRFAWGDLSGDTHLFFQGLDTIVDVYLNGTLLATHCNMFVPLRLDSSHRLRAANTLVLHFHTVFDRSSGRPVPLESIGDPPRPVRRPKQNYRTYLGPNPYFSRVGVFAEVSVLSMAPAGIEEMVVDAGVDADLERGRVTATVSGRSDAADTHVQVRVLAPGGAEVASAHKRVETGTAFATSVALTIEKPSLWWPRGYGEQNLYQVEVQLLADGVVAQAERRRIGFRHIAMPELLHFTVNGMPVKLWGGNWVTPHWSTAVWDSERAVQLLDMAEHAHFNTLRVWGVVESPPDEFYEMADRRGFLLWQDFVLLPFATDAESRAICRDEAAHCVKRLKHHPSILLWCGGNEEAMFHDATFGGPGGDWPGRAASEDDVAGVCRALDPARYFHPSSPYYGACPNDPGAGDTHGYTSIWFVPGYDDLNFASEDLRISAPPLRSLKQFMAPEDLWPDGYSALWTPGRQYPWPDSWQRYTTAEGWKKVGRVQDLFDAQDPAGLEYQLGMAAAQYYTETIERQRRGRSPEDSSGRRSCGGYLVWKFNDSWPQVYSGKVDYFLEPYILYYTIRRNFAPMLLSFDVGTYIWLWIVNDTTAPVSGTATVQLFHVGQNAVKQEITRPVTAPAGSSQVIIRLDEAGIGTFRREHILYVCLRDDAGHVLARANASLWPERQMPLTEARLSLRVEHDHLVLRSDRFARSVVLHGDAAGDEFGWFFDDNYFDLVPGEEKIVHILGRHRHGTVSAKSWYSPHSTTVPWQRSSPT